MRKLKTIISKNIKKVFFFSIGLFSKTIRKIFYANTINRNHKFIAVCGRGYSANKFFLEDYVLHSKVYLSNYCPQDLPQLSYYLKLRNKEISLVSCINEYTPNIFYSLFLNIRETILAKPYNLINSATNKSLRETFKFDAHGLKVRGIKNARARNEFHLILGNTGLLTLYEACLYAKKNNIKSIFVYGFDLYSNDKCVNNLLIEDCDSFETYINLKKVNEKLSKQMDYLISFYPDIKFKNFTLNRYGFKSENLENIYIDNCSI